MIKRARQILPRNATATFWDKLVNDISSLSNLANAKGVFVERVPDLSHEGVELKVPSGELASILWLSFDEADTEYVRVDRKSLSFPEVGDTRSGDGDREDRIRNLPSGLLAEALVGTCHPLVFRVSDNGLMMYSELVYRSIELDGGFGNDQSPLTQDVEDGIAGVDIGECLKPLGGGNDRTKRESFSRSSGSSSEYFLLSSGMKLCSPR